MRMLKRNAVVLSIFLSGVLLLSGCGTVGKALKLDTNLNITFKIASDINPDESNTPSPLFVRMYELKSTKTFTKAEFIDLYERDEEVLGADLIAKRELKRLKPGENRLEKFVLSTETRYIALFAEFFRYKGSKYGLVVPVKANNVFRDAATILVSGNKIQVVE